MSEVEKFTFTFTCHKYRKCVHLFYFEARKNMPQVNYGKQPTAHTNVDAYSLNVPNNINLANVANEFVGRKDNRKLTFRHFSQNFS